MRRRGALLAGSALLLAIAWWLTPPVPDEEGDAVVVAARGLGGFRVVLEDGLFMRARALARAGRLEEAVEVYALLLRFEPESQRRAVFLIDTLLDQVLPLEPEVERRVGWWLETHELVTRQLELAPENAELHFRAATLFSGWREGSRWSDLLPALQDRFPTKVRQQAIAHHLDQSIRLRRHLFGIQRKHLRLMSEEGPRLAAEAIRQGDEALYEQVVASLRWAREARADDMLEMLHPYEVARGGERGYLPLAIAIDRELQGLAEARRAHQAGEDLTPILDRWERDLVHSEAVAVLRRP